MCFSPSRFTGKERDTESGLDYFGGRYLSSGLGRWMTPDKDFTIKHIMPNPQRWNRYAYVINDPLARFDPDGLTDFAVFLSYAPADRGSHPAANWGKIGNDAAKHGNTVTTYSGTTGAHAANQANWEAAVGKGQVAVYIGTPTSLIPATARAVALKLFISPTGASEIRASNGLTVPLPKHRLQQMAERSRSSDVTAEI
jgi:RHS repeat-associated protein